MSSNNSRYEERGEIARGGMGVIFKVHDCELDRSLAMKRMMSAPDIDGGEVEVDRFARFMEEAHVTAQLDHPGIVPVYDLGTDDDGCAWYTMKLVRGRELGEIIRLARSETEGWNLPRLIGVLVRICQTVAYAHGKGVIHRDLKPANIMVGELGEVYVMDWGLARQLGHADLHDIRLKFGDQLSADSLKTISSPRSADAGSGSSIDAPLMTMDGAVIGTPAYMPPEQAAGAIGQVDHLSDIYALGAILYEILAEAPPYTDTGATVAKDVIDALASGPPTPVLRVHNDAPPELAAICEKAMSRSRDQRYATSLDLAEDLQAFLDGRVVGAHQTGAFAELKKWVLRNKPTAIAVAMVAASLVALGIVQTVSKEKVSTALAKESEMNALAEQRAEELQLGLYVTRMNLASGASAEPGGMERVSEFLRATTPQADENDHRRWEWYFYQQRADAAVLSENLQWRGIDWSPDGKHLLTTNGKKRAAIWEFQPLQERKGRQLLKTQPINGEIQKVQWSPDGSRFATSRLGDIAQIWNSETGDLIYTLKKGSGGCVAWSPDGNTLASFRTNGDIMLWKAKTGKPIRFLPSLGGRGSGLDWSPDGSRIATAAADGLIRLWDPDANVTVLSFPAEEKGEIALEWSHDGSRIAVVGNSAFLTIFQADTGERSKRFDIGAPMNTCVRWSNDDRMIATGSQSERVQVWDAEAGTQLRRFEGMRHEVDSVAWSPDDHYLAAVGRGMRVWDVTIDDPVTMRSHKGPAHKAVESPDGELIAVALGQNSVEIRDRHSYEVQRTIELDYAPSTVVWSPDGLHLLTGGYAESFHIWDPHSGKKLHTVPTLLVNTHQAVWSPDGTQLVAGHRWEIHLYETENWTRTGKLNHDGGLTNGLDWSPDGRWIASGGNYLVTSVYDARTREEVFKFPRGEDHVEALAWHPDSDRLAVAYGSSSIRIWELSTRSQIAFLEAHLEDVLSLAWSPDGSRLASSSTDSTIRLWRSESWDELITLREHTNSVNQVSWSDDGQRIISAGEDGKVVVRDVGTAETPRPIGR